MSPFLENFNAKQLVLDPFSDATLNQLMASEPVFGCVTICRQ